ncbi:hypothetical protein ACPXAL_22855, partial [Escherichia coli]
EWVHVQLHQQKGMISLSPPTICNSALQGWSGHNELVVLLQQARIPLHIYGDWQQLNYQLNVEQALRGSLEQEARDALKNWLKRR